MPESKKRSSEKRSSEKRSSKKRSSEKNKLTMEVIERFSPNSDFTKSLGDGIGRKSPPEDQLNPGGGRKRKTSKRKTSKRKHRKTKR